MLEFRELRITPDGKHLIIDVAVQEHSYYENVFIDSIIIDTQDTYVQNGPSSKPVYQYKVEEDGVQNLYALPEECSCNPILIDEDKSYCFTYGYEEGRHVRLMLSTKDITLNNMLFVYVVAKGTPSPDTPCGLDNAIIMQTVVDLYPFYQNTLCFLKELNNSCEVPKGFTDMILRLKALELCIRTGNYSQAIKYWKKFFSNNNRVVVTTSNCKYNG